MIAVGPGAPSKDGKVVPPNVKAGDRVLLPGWGGSSIKVGEEVSICPVHIFWMFWRTVGRDEYLLGCLASISLLLLQELRADEMFSFLQEYQIFRDSEILAKIQE